MRPKKASQYIKSLLFIVITSFTLSFNAIADERVVIGVLAKEGKEKAYKTWQSVGTYLERAIPQKTFSIMPLTFEEVEEAVETDSVDFVLVNPLVYIYLEDKYNISRMVTVNKRYGVKDHTTLGSVIFSRQDSLELHSLRDLKRKTAAAVHPLSLGGWQIANDALQRHDFWAENDFSSLEFLGTHDAVVNAVKNGEVEIGIVRTNTLERMEKQGEVTLEEFSILTLDKDIEDRRRIVSTRLYPEWPLSKLSHTSNKLSIQVASALLSMDENGDVAMNANIVGWYIPHNYQPVRQLMKRLELPPYDIKSQISIIEFIKVHREIFILIFFSLFILFIMLLRQQKLTKNLVLEIEEHKNTQNKLDQTNQVLNCLDRLREQFITNANPFVMFPLFLDELLDLTDSEFGFVADVLIDEDGKQYLKAYGISNLSWNEESRKLYENFKTQGLEFHNLDNLFGQAILTGKPIFSDNAEVDSRGKGFPQGHPSIRSFIGIPVYFGKKLVGYIALANRKEGYDDIFLSNLSPVILGLGQIIAARWDILAREETEKELQSLVYKDSLTGIYNRRVFSQRLAQQLQRLDRYGEKSTLLLLDIDYFKKVNDDYGHDMGDQILIELVQLVQGMIREIDVFIRWGGEEFLILLPQTDQDSGLLLANRLCDTVANHSMPIDRKVTVSVGLTSIVETDTPDSVVVRADSALYKAKNRGRNRAICE